MSCCTDASPHKVALVLSLVLPLLPLNMRARAARMCRAWRAAAAHPALREELSFERCMRCVNDAALASLCTRAGAALRTLNLDADVCETVTAPGILAALRGGACTGLRCFLSRPLAAFSVVQVFDAEQIQDLAGACPLLQHAACAVRCKLSDLAAGFAALPGPMMLCSLLQ